MKLKESLIHLPDCTSSFVLLEGITYFLNRHYLNQLFIILSQIQTSNSILAFDFWKTEDADNKILKKLMIFFSEHFGFDNQKYNLIDMNFIQNIKGYTLIESTDIQELEKIYTEDNYLSNNNKLLPEYYIIFKKSQS